MVLIDANLSFRIMTQKQREFCLSEIAKRNEISTTCYSIYVIGHIFSSERKRLLFISTDRILLHLFIANERTLFKPRETHFLHVGSKNLPNQNLIQININRYQESLTSTSCIISSSSMFYRFHETIRHLEKLDK